MKEQIQDYKYLLKFNYKIIEDLHLNNLLSNHRTSLFVLKT